MFLKWMLMLFACIIAEKSMPQLVKSQASYTETICRLVQAQRMACLLQSFEPNLSTHNQFATRNPHHEWHLESLPNNI